MKLIGGLLLAFLLLSGCGGGSKVPDESTAEKSAPSVSTPPTTATTQPSPSRSPYAPDVGNYALKVGQPREGSGTITTLMAVKVPHPPGQYREPQKGKKFVGFKVRECLKPDADLGGEPFYSTYNGEFFAASPTGDQATSSSSWDDWPAPKFPENVTMNPGDCVRGWLTIEIPRKMKVKKVIWRPLGTTVAEWVFR